MKTETKFRRVFCYPCGYLEWSPKGRRVYCRLPCTKDCMFQDWEFVWELAEILIQEEA